jgi:transposase
VAERRLAVHQNRIRPLVGEFERWMLTERARLSRHADIAKAMDYMLKRWPAFTRFLDDGRICPSNNAAERALHGIARRAWLLSGSDRGGERAAAMYGPIATAKLNGVDPQAWLADGAAPHHRSSGFPARRAAALGTGGGPKSPPLPPGRSGAALRARPQQSDICKWQRW